VPGPLERAEAAAFRDLHEAVPAALAAEHGFAVAEIDGAVCGRVRALDGVPEVNRVVGAGPGLDVGAVLGFYAPTGHIVSEGPEAAGLGERLRAAGYEPGYAWMKFARAPDPGANAPTDLRVEAVGAARGRDFAAAVAGGFGMPSWMAGVLAALPGRPGWTCLVAYDGTAPVGGGALFVDGDEGWLGMAATLPEARGRGAQGAILATRIRLAAEAGCTTVTTETGVREAGRPARSYRNILRAGFEEAHVRPNWRSP
jgi:GNAT superfamily N-acetyltransferase